MTSAGSVQNSTKNAEQKPSNSRYAGVQAEIRKKMLEKCQSEHLSGSLFPLNDVLISPRLLARIHPPSPDDALQYFPVLIPVFTESFDNPELLTGLPYPTITLEKALQWGSRIAVCGYAGFWQNNPSVGFDFTDMQCHYLSWRSQGFSSGLCALQGSFNRGSKQGERAISSREFPCRDDQQV